MATHEITTDRYSTGTDQVGNERWFDSNLSHDVTTTSALAPSTITDTVEHPIDSQVVVDLQGTRFSEQSHPAFPERSRKPKHWVRWLVIGLALAAISFLGDRYGVPLIREALNTVSTDDAFVTGHVTNVSPRIEGLVTAVYVDEDDHVEPDTLLMSLDREPYEIAVARSEAGLEVAQSQLVEARAQAKAQLTQARGSFFQRKNAQELLRRQVASLHAQVATLRARESSLYLAEVDQQRLAHLARKGSATQSELDQRNNTLDVAGQQVKEAWATIQETRAALGLPLNTKDPLDVPKDLEQQQSTIQAAVSSISSALAQVGIPFSAAELQQNHTYETIVGLDQKEGMDAAINKIVDKAPAVLVAKSSVLQAEKTLDDDRRKLRYTEIRAEVAGHIEDRAVHPGNRVEPGQTLLSIRPRYVWIDANFKETQLDHIHIGLPVKLYVDAYPHRVFQGRVAGFRPGTGLAASLLPPENATGNYVKVVQRLPVRIELAEPNPAETPLFAGLSVVPYVQIKAQPTGPGAGRRLRDHTLASSPDFAAGPVKPSSRIPTNTGARHGEWGH